MLLLSEILASIVAELRAAQHAADATYLETAHALAASPWGRAVPGDRLVIREARLTLRFAVEGHGASSTSPPAGDGLAGLRVALTSAELAQLPGVPVQEMTVTLCVEDSPSATASEVQ